MESKPHTRRSSEDEFTRRLRAIATGLSAAGLAIELYRRRGGLDLTATLHRVGRREMDVLIDEDGYTELRYWADSDATPAQVADIVVRALSAVSAIQARVPQLGHAGSAQHADSTSLLRPPDRAIGAITGYDGAVAERAGDSGMAGSKDTPTEQQVGPDSVRPSQPDKIDPKLVKRLENLAHGHPSSPYNADHTRKPPVPGTTKNELPIPGDPEYQSDSPTSPAGDEFPNTDSSSDRQPPPLSGDADRILPAAKDDTQSQPGALDIQPLTDAEYADHVHEVREGLDKARTQGLATDEKYTHDLDDEVWSKQRTAFHVAIIDEMCGRAVNVPNEHRAIMAGGLTGAGKSTVLDGYAEIDRSQFLTIDPDAIKEEMAKRGLIPQVEGLSPMEASDLVHEESSYIARWVAHRALAEGKNLIWDITMSSKSSTEQRIDDLRSAGYGHIEGIFVDIPPETSKVRAEARHRAGQEDYRVGKGDGGRFVPPEVIDRSVDPVWGSVNRKTFEEVKGRFDRWSVYDNSTDGYAPVLTHSSELEERRQ